MQCAKPCSARFVEQGKAPKNFLLGAFATPSMPFHLNNFQKSSENEAYNTFFVLQCMTCLDV